MTPLETLEAALYAHQDRTATWQQVHVNPATLKALLAEALPRLVANEGPHRRHHYIIGWQIIESENIVPGIALWEKADEHGTTTAGTVTLPVPGDASATP